MALSDDDDDNDGPRYPDDSDDEESSSSSSMPLDTDSDAAIDDDILFAGTESDDEKANVSLPQDLSFSDNLDQFRKKRKINVRNYFLSGCAEGAAAGVVVMLCTGGLGAFAIPVFALARGLHKACNYYFLSKAAGRMVTHGSRTKALLANLLLGAGIGAGTGASIGFFLAPFTFGLSIPVCAGIGAAIGFAEAGINHYQNKRLFDGRKKERYVPQEMDAYESARIGALAGAAIGLALAPFTGGLSIVVGCIVVVGAVVVGAGSGYFLKKYIPFGPAAQATTRNACVSAGASMGALAGAGLGILLAAPTAGLSIPVCALIGAFAGAVIGYCASPRLDRYLKVSPNHRQPPEPQVAGPRGSMSTGKIGKGLKRELVGAKREGRAGYGYDIQDETDGTQDVVSKTIKRGSKSNFTSTRTSRLYDPSDYMDSSDEDDGYISPPSGVRYVKDSK